MTAFKHLLVIGQEKSGTTWLQHLFDYNSNLFALFYDQELSYFTDKFPELSFSYDNYIKYFPVQSNDHRWICEVTPTYFSRPIEVIPRIKPLFNCQSNPTPRIIIILRDPVQRSYSDYLQKLRYGKIPKNTSFESSLAVLPSIMEKSFYYKDLFSWCNAFGRENVLVLFHHDLVEQPLKILKSIEDFLSLSHSLNAAYAGVKVNTTGLVTSQSAMKLRIKVSSFLRRIGLKKIIHYIKLSPFATFVNSFFYRSAPKISSADDSMLRKKFQADIYKLDEFLGLDSSLVKRWLGE